MPCFKPLQSHIVSIIASWNQKYRFKEPVLDAGAGQGAASLYFARLGLSVHAIDLRTTPDSSPLLQFSNVIVEQRDILEIKGTYSTICLIDVLEHIPEDLSALETCSRRLCPGGYLIVSVPVKASEWGWDDFWYGHLRRYEPESMKEMAAKTGFRVIEDFDVTFPFIWLLRKIYLSAYSLLGRKKVPRRVAADQTLDSSNASASEIGAASRIVENLPFWPFLFRIQSLFRSSTAGCNRIYLLKKI